MKLSIPAVLSGQKQNQNFWLILAIILISSFWYERWHSQEVVKTTPKRQPAKQKSVTKPKTDPVKLPEAKVNNYFIYSNRVTYNDTVIEGADAETFEILGAEYGKDKQHVYFEGRIVPRADVKSFQLVTDVETDPYRVKLDFIAEDDAHVFYEDKALDISKKELFLSYFTFPSVMFLDNSRYYPIFDGKLYEYNVDEYAGTFENLILMDDIDVSKARIIDNSSYTIYITDDTSVYRYSKKIENADPKTFQIVSDLYAKDKDRVYFDNNELIGANPETFEILSESSSYSKDDQKVFYREVEVDGADPKTSHGFGKHNYEYAADKKSVYKSGKKIIGADPASFRLDGQAGVDNKNAFWDGVKIEGSDASFQRVSNSSYYKDKRHVYFNSQTYPAHVFVSALNIMENADSDSFVLLDDSERGDDRYAKDKNTLFFEGRVIKYADSQSFSVADICSRQQFSVAKDNKHVYIDGEIQKDMVPERLEIIENGRGILFRDLNHVWFCGNEDISFVDADPETFRSIGEKYFTDKDSVYYFNKKLDGVSPENFRERKYNDGGIVSVGLNDTQVYYEDKQIPLSAESFQVCHFGWDSEYFCDDSALYDVASGKIVENITPSAIAEIRANRESLKKYIRIGNNLGNSYSIDGDTVLYQGKVVRHADIETFDTIVEIQSKYYPWAQDKEFIYRDGKVVGSRSITTH